MAQVLDSGAGICRGQEAKGLVPGQVVPQAEPRGAALSCPPGSQRTGVWAAGLFAPGIKKKQTPWL